MPEWVNRLFPWIIQTNIETKEKRSTNHVTTYLQTVYSKMGSFAQFKTIFVFRFGPFIFSTFETIDPAKRPRKRTAQDRKISFRKSRLVFLCSNFVIKRSPKHEILADHWVLDWVISVWFQWFDSTLMALSLLWISFAFLYLFRPPHQRKPRKHPRPSSSKPVKTQQKFIQHPVDSGSFYLKMGATLFGVGGMIYSCLQLGVFVENTSCFDFVMGVNPCLFILFIMFQLYFIFKNSQVSHYFGPSADFLPWDGEPILVRTCRKVYNAAEPKQHVVYINLNWIQLSVVFNWLIAMVPIVNTPMSWFYGIFVRHGQNLRHLY